MEWSIAVYIIYWVHFKYFKYIQVFKDFQILKQSQKKGYLRYSKIISSKTFKSLLKKQTSKKFKYLLFNIYHNYF